MKAPTVSVVIITYKRPGLLAAAIQSVLAQTYSDFELIVVDDCSPDDTADVVHGFDDPRIRFLRHETNLGEGGARNTGVQAARGSYVAFLDDDDEWVPNKLAQQVAVLDAAPESTGLVYTGVLEYSGATGEPIREVRAPYCGQVRRNLVEQGNFIRPSATMVRRRCLEEAGAFDRNLPGCLDYDMWLRVSAAYAVEAIDHPLVRYRIHDERLSTAYDMHVEGRSALIRKYPRDFDTPTRSNSQLRFLIGVWACLSGKPREGRRMYAKAIALNPFSVKAYLAIALSLFGSRPLLSLLELRRRFALRGAG